VSFVYFAYGSNMLPARLKDRCNNAHVIGKAMAEGYTLEFSKPGKDGSGKATLISGETQTTTTPGALFEIERIELRALDKHEGAGHGYDRDDSFTVTHATTGETLTATTYLASETDPALKPFDWYLALVLAGSHHHDHHDDHLSSLRATSHIVDTVHDREGRIDALRALAKHGYHDHHALLHGYQG